MWGAQSRLLVGTPFSGGPQRGLCAWHLAHSYGAISSGTGGQGRGFLEEDMAIRGPPPKCQSPSWTAAPP